ncbi:hypothetical protein CHS0354_019023 [Potamilus streckersoni]|uniref:TIR domain-containing protein n=1 Tax=Potamilus streckersoni TaxID=2493646 RepID=A0AAE0SAS5_9BIVA|nr:hypothetical protein CHS0354_019023 [Potamilus streckersoni]
MIQYELILVGFISFMRYRSSQPLVSSANCTESTIQHQEFVPECNGKIEYFCDGRKLTNIPNIPFHLYCAINLHKNEISNVREKSFPNNSRGLMVLDLSKNKIDHIVEGAFQGLLDLIYLNLRDNMLGTIISSKQVSFAGAHQLQHLDIAMNQFRTFSFLSKALHQLQNLKYLRVDGCQTCRLGPEFYDLQNLTTLVLGSYYSSCVMKNVSKDFFENVPILLNLSLSDCGISDIDSAAFSPLSRLAYLDLSNNEDLEFDGVIRALKGLQEHNSLKLLNINHVYPIFGRSTVVNITLVQSLRNLTSLETLHLDDNKIELFDKDVLPQLPKSLKALTVINNRLTAADYLADILQVGDNEARSLAGFEYLDVSFQNSIYRERRLPRSKFDFINVYFKSFHEFTQIFSPSKALKFFRSRQIGWEFPIRRIHFEPNGLEEIDISYNYLKKWLGPVTGLDGLKRFSITNNYCDEVTSTFFSGFASLEILEISNNMLGYALKNDSVGEVFKHLTNLKVLDLSDNKISTLPTKIFSGLFSLQILNLTINMLHTWNVETDHMTNLVVLDLSFNRLEDLPEKLRTSLDRLSNYKNITVNITKNRIPCTCQRKDFWTWVSFTTVKVITDVECASSTLEKECISYGTLTAITASVLVCFCFAVVAGLVYRRYKWKLMYLFYSTRENIRHTGEGYRQISEYDVFISFASDDQDFVKNIALPRLNEFELKTLTADQFMPGTPIRQNIIRAIQCSRKIVFIVSPDFLTSEWCEFEVRMAVEESRKYDVDLMIFVMYENIGGEGRIPNHVRNVLDERTYIEYPKEPSERDVFWGKLWSAIKSD